MPLVPLLQYLRTPPHTHTHTDTLRPADAPEAPRIQRECIWPQEPGEKAEWALPWRPKKAKPRAAHGWLSMSERSGKMADRRSKPWKEDQGSNCKAFGNH